MDEAVTEHTMLMGQLCSLSEAVLNGIGEQETEQPSVEETNELMGRANRCLQEACDALQAIYVGNAPSSHDEIRSAVNDPGFYRLFWRTFLPSITVFNLLYGQSRAHDAR